MAHSPLSGNSTQKRPQKPKAMVRQVPALLAHAEIMITASRLKQERAKSRLLARRLKELRATNEALTNKLSESRRMAAANRLQLEVLNNMPAVAWTVTPDGQCDFINRFYLDATGLSEDDCLAPLGSWKNAPDALPPFLSGVHPDHRDRAAKVFWGGIRSGQGWTFDAPFLHADRHYHWHFDRAVPLRDDQGNIARFVGTCSDIDELRVAQRELKDTQQRLETIVDGTPSVVFLRDIDGRYVLVNRAFEQLAGIDRAHIIGKADEELFTREQAVTSRKHDLAVIKAATPLRFEEQASTVEGLRHLIVQSFPLFNESGAVRAVGGVVFDITDRKRIEDALRDAQAELARVSRLTSMETLTTSIAHEINQPLAAIATNATTCLHWLDARHANHGKAVEVARQMRNDAMRACAVIARIHALMTKTRPERTPIEINTVIKDVLTLTHGELRRHDVELRTVLSENLPKLFGDRVQLEQVIVNLILNAVEALAPIDDRPRLLSISSLRGEHNHIAVRVSDNGVGIAAGAADEMFSAFFTTKSKGTGLGLSICRSIIDAHNGQMLATPESPHGAMFQFSVPVEPVEDHV